MLLDGAETAPPEDVGDIYGFYDCMKIYGDKKHPEHEAIKAWAKELYFREYDPEWINRRLQFNAYKKTEWDKINQENYRVIENEYVK